MASVDLARKPLQEWLKEEFDVKYSEAVFNELLPFTKNWDTQRNWEKDVGNFPKIANYEKAIFSSHKRSVEGIYCNHCKQRTLKYEMFTPDLAKNEDKGERHNCCLALQTVVQGHCSQTIFLTDDIRARHSYTTYFFDLFPVGVVWSSLDFITHLFVRHWKDISLESVKDALRDINTGYTGSQRTESQGPQNAYIRYKEAEKKSRRLKVYYNKVEQIHQIFSQI
jgi:hypothetical protein